jgi:hypothetical protein
MIYMIWAKHLHAAAFTKTKIGNTVRARKYPPNNLPVCKRSKFKTPIICDCDEKHAELYFTIARDFL